MKRMSLLAIFAATFAISGCSASSVSMLDSFDDQLTGQMAAQEDILFLSGKSDKLCVYDDLDEGNELAVKSAGLFNITDLDTVYVQNPEEQVGIASLTKVMTALLALENGDMNSDVVIADTGIELEKSAVLCGFNPGDRMKFSSLLSSMLVVSGNDAANAVAVEIGGSVSAFVDMMNAKARELHAENTHFVNPNGLDASKHYSSAYDMYIIFSKCLEYQQFRDIISTKAFVCYYTDSTGDNVSREFTNGNYYLNGNAAAPEGITVIGGKTGHTYKTGYSLIVLAKDDETHKEYVAVVIGAETREALYEQMNLLLQKI